MYSDLYYNFIKQTESLSDIGIINRWHELASVLLASGTSLPNIQEVLRRLLLTEMFKCSDSFSFSEKVSTEFLAPCMANLTTVWKPASEGHPFTSDICLESGQVRAEFRDIELLLEQMKNVYLSSRDILASTRQLGYQRWPYVYSGKPLVAFIRAVEVVLNERYFKVLQGICKRPVDRFKVNGQIKLHPPSDNEGAEVWHLDGDNSAVKILFYLCDHPYIEGDGPFTIAVSSEICNNLTPTQRVLLSRGEFLRDIATEAVNPDWLGKALSAMPWLSFSPDSNLSYVNSKSFPVKLLNGALFTGSSILHRGGGNINLYRPVFQGYVFPSW
jgi:hypothetical protein